MDKYDAQEEEPQPHRLSLPKLRQSRRLNVAIHMEDYGPQLIPRVDKNEHEGNQNPMVVLEEEEQEVVVLMVILMIHCMIVQ